MMEQDKMTEQESLRLISEMIHKAKNSYHDSGLGPILWGSVITLCSIVTWLQIHFDFELPFDIWILTLVAVVPQILIVRKEKKQRKARRYDESMMDYVWTCFGISIFLLIFINANVIAKLNPVFEKYSQVTGSSPEFDYGSFITSFFLLLYGIPTIITGGCQKLKPMLWGGIVCWVCCVISVFTKIETDMLLTALAAICAWLIPGIILRNRYKKLRTADV
jgi:uncharacterized protein with PQ loop repeat